MRLHRFYINQKLNEGAEIRISDPELLHQWMKVFRLSANDRVIVFNGSGDDFECYFKILSRKEAVLVVEDERENKNVVKTELHVFQSIIKKDNFEFIVEKCTEIGAKAFHPLITERSEKKDLNLQRLNKIATEASEQSGRTNVPEIFEPQKLEDAIEKFDGELFVFDFDGEEIPEKINKKVGVLVGPEGGWSDKEREIFKNKKIKSVSFGPQVLRAETAAIVASALILMK